MTTDLKSGALHPDFHQLGTVDFNRSPAQPSRLDIVEISKSFASRQIVDKVGFHVNSGEIIGLLGPNGAGKTTCFSMIVGLETCDSGQVLINDKDITNLPIYSRAKLGLGYLPQEPSIFRRLNVEDNIRAVLQTQKKLNANEQRALLEKLLETFQIQGIRSQLGTTLSGGERRRVEIARAVALQPRFILLDEPFAGVDPIAVDDVISLIHMLSSWRVGVLITDHNVRETLRICTRAHIMNQGKIFVSGTAEEIMNDDEAKRIYFGKTFRL